MKWTFWIDCGGTFTDIIGLNDKGEHRVHKVLSHSPHYESAVVKGISDYLEGAAFKDAVKEVRLGTTVATNAFLERKGVRCALVTTLGHRDVLEIRNQNRPKLFELNIEKVPPLYSYVTSIQGRMNSRGEVLTPFDEEIARFELKRILDQGINSIAISLMHATVNPTHELALYQIAKDMGFSYISLSHKVSPIAKYIPRTETAVIDSYLSPYLQQYTEYLQNRLEIENIYYMQSDGSLCKGEELKGHNALLSGPAGGLIGAIEIAKAQGHDKILTFDMGGTSTDVAIYDRELAINPTPDFYGLKLLCPMVDIHTVAAGGGSILSYDHGRFLVGPDSAGAHPGPACYRHGGPLTVTDANLFLGRIEAKDFPHIFGPEQNQPLDEETVASKFMALEKEIGMPAKEIARGFLDVAIESMSRAIRKVSIERGQDPKDFCLVSFGGAAGQLALKVAETLAIKQVLIHPLSSVLSAYGIGRSQYQISVQANNENDLEMLRPSKEKEFPSNSFTKEKAYLLRSKGSDHEVELIAKDINHAKTKFQTYHKKTFGQDPTATEVVAVSLKLKAKNDKDLVFNQKPKQLKGPQLICENNTTIVLEEQWEASRNQDGLWSIQQSLNKGLQKRNTHVELEIFYQRFQFIAEQMGIQLQRLAESLNIKERNDFSCALFTETPELIANAPHIPVHLGSMDEAVKAVKKHCEIKPNESYILNSPVYGGTHLPDVTIITPVFYEDQLFMWVASRGHHADIGGSSPGSMPGNSTSLAEEGVIIPPTQITKEGIIDREKLENILTQTRYPVRNFQMNLRDIQAKLSANKKGAEALVELARVYSPKYLNTMSEKILSYTHQKIKEILSQFPEGTTTKKINSKRKLQVSMEKNEDHTIFDFHGSSKLLKSNFNAPIPVVKASVMFSLRSMIQENIPLNSGVMRAVHLKIPENCMLNPAKDSPVVAGNVETSQAISDLIFQALGVKANSYGSMNNLSFGNSEIQYYETICGGSGATTTKNGTSAVQVNMTNSLLTDPEVFETRLPVIIELIAIRHGSGGKGRFQGGNGVYRRLLFLEQVSVNTISQAREIPPSGLAGGQSAMRGLNQIEEAHGYRELPECFEMDIAANTRLSISTPGGGGYGQEKPQALNYIFSFGSNMDIAQIRERCPSAVFLSRGTVEGFEIRFSRYSPVRKGGVADMFQAPGNYVLGLIIAVNDKDLATLDEIECAQNGYRRIDITAHDDNNNKIQCQSYDVIDKKPDIPPTKIYEWLVYSGAFHLNAPHSYLERIKSYRV